MEQVEVTDSDREALAATIEDMGLLSSLTASHIRQGLYDNDCRFIAKARIEATRTNDQAKDEEIARLRTSLESAANDLEWLAENCPDCMGWTGHDDPNGPWPCVKEAADQAQNALAENRRG